MYLCTNALLLEKKIGQYKPNPYFVWSIHLDGDKEMHDKSVCQTGVYDRAVAAIKRAKDSASASTSTARCSTMSRPSRAARFFDSVMAMGIDGITVSPGYAYERAPDQQHFLNRERTKNLFRDILRRGRGGKNWAFSQSSLFLDFLAGNQTYHCTPWGNPTYTVFGWQKPCYLLGEGYTKTFQELMEGTDWDAYGTGNYEKCADCMVHSGYEGDRRAGCHQKSAEGGRRRAARRAHRRRDGAGDFARQSAAGGIQLLTPRRPQARRDQGEQGPARASDGCGVGRRGPRAYPARRGTRPEYLPAGARAP